MPSSILPFKRRWPLSALAILLVAVAAWLASAGYTLLLNPEVVHFKRTHRIKESWADRMTREHGAKVVAYGGSSCEFSIDGERMLEKYHWPCVNLGRGAGMGSVVLTMAALDAVRPGDTLIIALEPGLLTDPLEIPSLGVQFSLAVGHLDWIRHPLPPAQPVPVVDVLLALRPGGSHFFTLIGKLLRGGPLYRYRPQDMRPSGWNQTEVRLPIEGPPGHGARISEEGRQFLHALRQWCDANQVRVFYSLPWAYTPPEKMAAFQQDNLRFLLQVAPIIPVLQDPRLGAHPVREDFSDTAWHLVEDAAARRTDELGEQLKRHRVWTLQELESRIR